jgi:hypothetical protein
MDDRELCKEFLKKWARYANILSGMEMTVLGELVGETGAHTQAKMIFATMMTAEADCRDVALRLALADFQVMVKER